MPRGCFSGQQREVCVTARRVAFQAHHQRKQFSSANRCARKMTARTSGVGTTRGLVMRESARAERQEDFLTNRFVDVIEVQGGLALVAQNFEYGRTAFFGNLDARVLEMDYVHLQGLNKEVLVV